MNNGMVDSKTLCRRVLRYLLLGLTIAFAQLVIPKRNVSLEEVISMAIIAAATFAVIDMFGGDETLSNSTRQGAGLGIGLKMVGIGL
jgi:hypothetical protein